MNKNPNEKIVCDNSDKQMVFHLYEFEYVPKARGKYAMRMRKREHWRTLR